MRHRWAIGVLAIGLAHANSIVACSSPREVPLGRSEAKIVTPFPAMIVARGAGACAALGSNGEVLYSGSNVPGGYLSTNEVFDPVSHKWAEVEALPRGRGDHRAVTLATGDVLVSGGYGDNPSDADTASPSTNVFDAVKHTWSTRAPMNVARADHTLTRLSDGRILATGGLTGYLINPGSDAEVYDPKANTWTVLPSMTVRRAKHTAVALPDGRVFVVGNQASAIAEVLAKDASVWTSTGPMKTPRQSAAAAVLTGGRVIVIGGTDGSTAPLSTTEVWDPTTNAFTDGPTLASAHGDGVGAVVIASGGAIVGGGDAEALVERLDAKATSWTTVGKLGSKRTEACIVAIPGGALFAGGTGPTYTVDGYLGSDGGTACKSDDECASGSCASGKCTAPAPLDAGVPDATPEAATDGGAVAETGSGKPTVDVPFQVCAKDADCATGHCSDGVCCNTACTETCHSCALPGSAGTCTVEPIGVDLRGECGVALSCTGTCGGGGTCIGATAGTQCAPSKCTSPSTGVGPAICAGHGARCPTDVTAFDCAPYACEPIFGACRTTCTSSNDCAGGNVCDVDSKVCVTPAPNESSGGCSYARSGSWSALFALLALAVIRRRSSAAL